MISEWIVAFGTLLLAFIAVFQDKIRAYFLSPHLDCKIELNPPDCHRTVMQGGNDPFYSYYFLFQIWNTGNITAKNVEVIISDVSKKEGNGFKSLEDFFPDNLPWSFTGQKIYCDYISPGTFKHCTLGHIHDPKFRDSLSGEHNQNLPVNSNEAIFCFDVNFRSNRLTYLVEPGVYRFVITIGSENAKTISKKFLMSISGKWFEDESRMLNEGFSIEEVT
ncbi:MAG: hypothetical protein JW878_07905 [Methanomicrobia archaeon]|nr:hypothetical protein [Methanomicrobia archaeon]